ECPAESGHGRLESPRHITIPLPRHRSSEQDGGVDNQAGLTAPHDRDAADHPARNFGRAGRKARLQFGREGNQLFLEPGGQLAIAAELFFQTRRQTFALGEPWWKSARLGPVIRSDGIAVVRAEDQRGLTLFGVALRAVVFIVSSPTALALCDKHWNYSEK